MKNEHEKLADQTIGDREVLSNDDVTALKNAAREYVEVVSKICPEGRRKSLAITHVETSSMFAVKSLFDLTGG